MGSGLLYISATGLAASKKSLRTSGHNIANANTEGYSRQRVEQSTNTPVGFGNLTLGTGVRVTDVKRIHNKYAEKKLMDQTTEHNYNKERAFQLTQIEQVFNENQTDGVNASINKFFNSFRELTKQPESETVRSIVRENAKLMVKDFRRSKEYLQDIEKSIDRQFMGAVEDVNSLLDTVALLNKKIRSLESAHGETGDLRDQRDLAIKNLSEFFELEVYVNEKGLYTVQAEGVGSLVVGGVTQPITVKRTPDASNGVQGGGEIYFKERQSTPITHNFKGGKLAALYKIRNEDLIDFKGRLDSLAYNITNSVNAIHRRGFANRNLETDAQGNTVDNGGGTGINFFETQAVEDNAASLIDISTDVKGDLNNITTAYVPNAPGDNRIAIAIAKLQHEKLLDGGRSTFEESYQEAIGQIGISTRKSRVDTEHSEGLLAQANSVRERISGVSIDEETADMMKYQQAYDASARVMRVADEMFKTVLGIMP